MTLLSDLGWVNSKQLCSKLPWNFKLSRLFIFYSAVTEETEHHKIPDSRALSQGYVQHIKTMCLPKSAQNIKHVWFPTGWNQSLKLKESVSVTIIHYAIFYEICQLKSADFQLLALTPPDCESVQKSGQMLCRVFQPLCIKIILIEPIILLWFSLSIMEKQKLISIY